MNAKEAKLRAKVKASLSSSAAIDKRGYALDRAPEVSKRVNALVVAEVLDEVLYELDPKDPAVSKAYRAKKEG